MHKKPVNTYVVNGVNSSELKSFYENPRLIRHMAQMLYVKTRHIPYNWICIYYMLYINEKRVVHILILNWKWKYIHILHPGDNQICDISQVYKLQIVIHKWHIYLNDIFHYQTSVKYRPIVIPLLLLNTFFFSIFRTFK